MVTLFRYELKKLLSRKLTWLLLAISMGTLANFDAGMLGLRSVGDYVRGMRDVYAKYEGRVLTEALVAEAEADLEIFAAAHEGEFEMSDDEDFTGLYHSGDDNYCAGAWSAYEDIIHDSTQEYYLEAAVRYQGYLDAGCYEDGKPLTQSDRLRLENETAMFINQPPVVRYAEGWRLLELCNQSLGIFPLFLLALCLTPLFSGERTSKMEGVLLCTAKRRQLAMAKLLAASTLALTIFITLYGMQLLIIALTYGLDGGTAFAYYYSWSSAFIAGRTLLGVFVGGAAVALAAMLALSMLAALFSAAFRNTLVAMIAYAGLSAAHFVLAGILRDGAWKGSAWETVSKIVYLLPGNVLNDGDNGIQINRILADPAYVAIGLSISLVIAVVAAVLTQALYLKQRKV